MASITSKVKKAVTNYAKNVAGGAKIVASAVSSAAKKVGGASQTGAVLNAKVGEGLNAKQTLQAYKTLGMTSSVSTPKVSISVPKVASVSKIPSGTNLLSSSVAKQVARGGLKTSNSGSSSLSNISPDGTALTSNLSMSNLSGFSPVAGTSFTPTSVGIPTSSVINTPVLGTDKANQKLTFGEQPLTDYTKYIPPEVALPETTTREDALTAYLKTLSREAPSTEDAYLKAQKETQILDKQQKVTSLTEQLNSIVNKGQAAQLSLVGQGRGIPEAIIGGQQAQIGRETAIAALPVQAQLSAAQGDLEMANSNLETLFKIYSDDAEREYSIRKEQKKMVYELATEKEKRALEKQDKLEERAYQATQDLIKSKQTIAIEAAKNGASAGTLTKIANATDFASAVSAAGPYLSDTLDRQIKQAQLNKLLLETGDGKKIIKVNGIDYYQNSDGSLSEIQLPGNDQKAASLGTKINLIDEIINSPGLSASVGTTGLSRTGGGRIVGALGSTAAGAAGGTAIFPGVGTIAGGIAGLATGLLLGSPAEVSGAKQDFIAGVEQLISREFLDNLIAVKAQGATFGALQKAEQDALTQAASKIGSWRISTGSGEERKVVGYNTTEASFIQELNKIKSLAQTAYERAGGSSAQDTVTSTYLNEIDSYLNSSKNDYLQAGYILN